MKRVTRNSKPRRRKIDIEASKLRSSISNGRLLLTADHRSATMRRLRDLVSDSISDLGGADQLSNAEQLLVRRAAMLALQAELMEARWQENNGEAGSKAIESYQRLTNTLRRTLESLGLKRRARPIETDWREMARQARREARP